VQAIIAAHGKGPIIRAATILRAERIEERRAERLKRIAAQCDSGPLPQGPWPLIFADPPWRYLFSPTASRAVEDRYETMTLDDICALPVSAIAAPNAMLFLCVPQAILKQAFDVIEAWGFDCCGAGAVWLKSKGIGEGHHGKPTATGITATVAADPASTRKATDGADSQLFGKL
jgi:hypothetical protein